MLKSSASTLPDRNLREAGMSATTQTRAATYNATQIQGLQTMQNEMTPARRHLAERISERADKIAAVTTEIDNANRLSVIHDGVGPARSELVAYDTEHAAAMSRWAKGLINGRPTTNSAQRDVLARAVADAEQSSAAATVAQAGFQSAAERASAPLARIENEIREAAKLVALEEATSLLPAIAEAIATAERLRHRLDDARAEIMSGFEYGANTYPQAAAALAEFDAARGVAQARPIQTADAVSWRKFSAALERDASISFSDAQAKEIAPLPSISTAADVATAAMLAAASFPSTGIVR
jgi:hypothetical protein